jgi:esterase/lipase
MEHLLLLHGAIGAKDQLEILSKQLENDFIVHTMNFSGHGSAVMPDKYSISLFSQDVIDYIDQRQIDSIHIFGYSMGGYVALFLAAHYPAKIKRIFTFATKFHWTPEIASKEIKMLASEKILEKLPAFATTLKKRHSPNDWKIVLKKTAAMMIEMGDKSPLYESDFPNIHQRVLIGVGDRDTMVTLEETIDVFRKIKNSSMVVIPDTQHPIEKIDVKRLAGEILLFFR